MLTAFDSGRLLGAVTGSGTPRVLALHGWRRTHRDFGAVLRDLDGICLDLPGFGASPPPPQPWGAAEYAATVATVLDAMATPVVVLGHSFGGRVAVHLAARHPEDVSALVLTGVPLLRPPGTARVRPALAFRVGRTLHARRLIGEARMEALRRRYGSADYRAETGVMRAVHVRAVNETYEDQLRAVRCPVELVWGADDTTVPATVAGAAAALLAHARVTVLPGVGHLTPLAAPEALAEAVGRHLS